MYVVKSICAIQSHNDIINKFNWKSDCSTIKSKDGENRVRFWFTVIKYSLVFTIKNFDNVAQVWVSMYTFAICCAVFSSFYFFRNFLGFLYKYISLVRFFLKHIFIIFTELHHSLKPGSWCFHSPKSITRS